ncbi:TIGR00730 family Rossman fold protein [Skermanella mucosa]|uniref:LOG family protein n=1 Tax=Skermanella mucosa TaxID=1789672 RepID=UPI00192B561F|nr:TIGR00730 family Rossman fold protein [Skermanella mucosa]UEM20165.1 TIGR00730 family Rossman fold protein [Skermanella mucosa]
MKDLTSICVYCGSSSRVSDTYKDAAHLLGTLIGQSGRQLVYGGGRVGLMGIVADAAIAAGGPVVGIIPEHIQVLEVEHTGLTELLVVDSMHTRKRLMVDRSDAFVVLPGGLGTLDETFEILTWKQLHLHDKPVVIANIDGYWDPFEALLDHMIAQGFAQPGHRKLFTVVNRVEDVMPALSRQPESVIKPETKWL